MAELKTAQNEGDVEAFLAGIDNEKRRQDCRAVVALMQKITGEPPKMWGSSIIGFGKYHYKYESGREGDWFLTGCSPRKQSLTLYIMSGFDKYDELMGKLGKYKTGKSCLYVNKLEDVDLEVLKALIARSAEYIAQRYR